MISFRCENYLYSYNKMKPKPFSTHLHKYYEFLYFVGGDAVYIVDGKEYSASDGDLFITRPGELHSIVFRSERDYERHFIQIPESFLEETGLNFWQVLRKTKNHKIPSYMVSETRIKDCFFGVRENVENRREESDVLVKAFVVQLLGEIERLLPNVGMSESTENERVVAAKAFINKNLKRQITLDEVSESAFSDKYYLSHLFKKETGMTVMDYINLQRIALAKKYILEGMGATEVYTECGFGDYSSFYRVFKKLCGKSPKEFFKGKR